MIRVYLTISLLLLSPSIWAQGRGGGGDQAAPAVESFSSVSFDFQAGYNVGSLINQDGDLASYKGNTFAVDMNFVGMFPDANIGIGPFAHWHFGSLDSSVTVDGISQSIDQQDMIYGLKFFVFPFYAGFGSGNLDLKMATSDGASLNLNSSQLGFTLGLLGFKITDSTYIGINGWYKTGFINAADNPTTDNTKYDSWSIYLRFTIFPAFELL